MNMELVYDISQALAWLDKRARSGNSHAKVLMKVFKDQHDERMQNRKATSGVEPMPYPGKFGSGGSGLVGR